MVQISDIAIPEKFILYKKDFYYFSFIIFLFSILNSSRLKFPKQTYGFHPQNVHIEMFVCLSGNKA